MQQPTVTLCCETEEKRSRFIAELIATNSTDDVKRRIEQLKEEHPKASHVCSGFRIAGKNRQVDEGFSDDGEPSGTAGMPILKVIRHHKLVNCAVLITRYFGGTKLGTGGLQRAYGQSCSAVIQQLSEQQLKPVIETSPLIIEADFQYENSIRHFCEMHRLSVSSMEYNSRGFILIAEVNDNEKDAIIQQLRERNVSAREYQP